MASVIYAPKSLTKLGSFQRAALRLLAASAVAITGSLAVITPARAAEAALVKTMYLTQWATPANFSCITRDILLAGDDYEWTSGIDTVDTIHTAITLREGTYTWKTCLSGGNDGVNYWYWSDSWLTPKSFSGAQAFLTVMIYTTDQSTYMRSGTYTWDRGWHASAVIPSLFAVCPPKRSWPALSRQR